MDLYLVRHAIAEERRPGLDDADRRLTEVGRQRFSRVVDHLDAIGVRFDRVLHSPWRRARETAELLQPLLDGSLVATEELADDPGQALLAAIAGERVALVGHEPWMSELMVWLLTGDPRGSFAIAFKKGGIAWLRGAPNPGQMELRALLPPRVLRAT